MKRVKERGGTRGWWGRGKELFSSGTKEFRTLVARIAVTIFLVTFWVMCEVRKRVAALPHRYVRLSHCATVYKSLTRSDSG